MAGDDVTAATRSGGGGGSGSGVRQIQLIDPILPHQHRTRWCVWLVEIAMNIQSVDCDGRGGGRSNKQGGGGGDGGFQWKQIMIIWGQGWQRRGTAFEALTQWLRRLGWLGSMDGAMSSFFGDRFRKWRMIPLKAEGVIKYGWGVAGAGCQDDTGNGSGGWGRLAAARRTTKKLFVRGRDERIKHFNSNAVDEVLA